MSFSSSPARLGLGLTVLLAMPFAAHASTTILGDPADNEVQTAGDNPTYTQGASFVKGGTTPTDPTLGDGFYSGTYTSGGGFGHYSGSYEPIFVFQLPTLAAGAMFTTASFNATLTQITSGTATAPTFNGDLYGLGARAAADVQARDYFVGATDTGATLIQDNFVTPTTALGTLSTSSAALLSYLNVQYGGGANAGKYVFVRINPDIQGQYNANPNAGSATVPGYAFASGNATSGQPSITFDSGPGVSAAPEPAQMEMLALCAFGLLGSIVMRRRKTAVS